MDWVVTLQEWRTMMFVDTKAKMMVLSKEAHRRALLRDAERRRLLKTINRQRPTVLGILREKFMYLIKLLF
jgi:hypothetical protein